MIILIIVVGVINKSLFDESFKVISNSNGVSIHVIII